MSRQREGERAAHSLAHLHRYLPLVDAPEAFLSCAGQALPRVIWSNPLRGDPHETDAMITARWPGATPVSWRPHTWRLPADAMPGQWIGHMLGRIHGQEEAALWPAALLDAQPGERVLDLCAAPGNKTAQLAIAMENRGLLVANDRKWGRLAMLRRTLDRLGVTCVAVSRGDGVRLGGPEGTFDRVLVDGPCSCEGTSRKSTSRRAKGQDIEALEKYRGSVTQVQKALLRKALKLVKPGGAVVYSTCTYAPEENEGVLHAIPPELASIEPITPPGGLRVAPGISTWQGADFRPDVVNAARIWPHHNDTGGFFLALLRRL